MDLLLFFNSLKAAVQAHNGFMWNGRRLGRGVESRIVAAATDDALVNGRATREAIAAVGGLVFSGLQRISRRVQADLRSNKTLRDKVAHQGGPGAIGGSRARLEYPPKCSMMG